ncbi:MAG: ABC transporter permease [Candidatus Planktophila sp.]|nr:ABC transporter permease [Candidatus Planktophila sp.]
MLGYIMRRIGVSIMILFGSSFLVYNLAAYASDPLAELRLSVDDGARQQIIALTRDLQLNVPPPLRYFLWLKGILGLFVGKLNMGMTRDASSVQEELAFAIPVTLRLVLVASITALLLGLALGIISALRQYSRFDYGMTFLAFLLFSLPIFWVAVLLKEFMAIQFNNFLSEPNIPLKWMLIFSCFTGVFWSSLFGGERKRFWSVFAGAFATSFVILWAIDLTDWYLHPGLGPILIGFLSVGIAMGVASISTGLTNIPARNAALTMAGLAVLWYYPAQWVFNNYGSYLVTLLMLVLIVGTGFICASIFSKVDRGPIARTAIITGVISGFLIFIDRVMQSWQPYFLTDAVNGRPVPTYGQRKDQLVTDDFWLNNLDIIMHLILPTLALILISLAGWIRYSRGALLEVLNQDYIRTARAKGLNERTVITRHALRNMMLPLSSLFVGEFVGLIGGAVITERVFGWQGMGTLGIRAINSYDLNLLMGVNLLLSILVVLGNLLADLVYSALDPRIRLVKE